MKNYFMKYKDTKLGLEVLYWILTICSLSLFFSLAVVVFLKAFFGIYITIITDIFFAMGWPIMIASSFFSILSIIVNGYISKNSRCRYSIESEFFNMSIEASKYDLQGGNLVAVINGEIMYFASRATDTYTRKSMAPYIDGNSMSVMRIFEVNWNGKHIQMYMTILSCMMCMLIDGKMVVERNMINFKVLEEVLQSQNITQN